MAIILDVESDQILQNIGLDEKEISVYKALLELGEATVLMAAKKGRVKRPTAYLVLNSLESKGLATRVAHGKRTFFTPQHPKKIITEAELRLSELREFVPQLEAMMQQRDDRPRVTIYEGKDALDKAYDDYFLIKGEILFMSNMDLVHEIFARTLQKFELKEKIGA